VKDLNIEIKCNDTKKDLDGGKEEHEKILLGRREVWSTLKTLERKR
jgi:hypothetical protein